MERTTDYVTNPFSIWVIAAIAVTAALVFFGWKEWKKKGSLLILFGSGWFLSFLIPVSGIVPINGILYEHWLYLPLIGFCLIMLGLSRLFNIDQKFSKEKIQYLFGGLFIVYTLLVWQQSYIWGDHIRFYEHNLKYANTSRLHNNLAMAYAERGYLDKAIVSYQNALELNPGYPQIYHNLGNVYLEKKDYQQAESWFLKALEKQPGFYQSHLQLIRLAVFNNDFDLAYQRIDKLKTNVAGAEEFAEGLRKEVTIIQQSSKPGETLVQ